MQLFLGFSKPLNRLIENPTRLTVHLLHHRPGHKQDDPCGDAQRDPNTAESGHVGIADVPLDAGNDEWGQRQGERQHLQYALHAQLARPVGADQQVVAFHPDVVLIRVGQQRDPNQPVPVIAVNRIELEAD